MRTYTKIAAMMALAPSAAAFTVSGGLRGKAPMESARRGIASTGPSAAQAKPVAEESSSSTLLAGAVAAAVLLFGASNRRDGVARAGVQREGPYPGQETGDPSRGPSFRSWVNLGRKARKIVGRQRFFRQQKFLAEAGITAAKGGYKKWYPNQDRAFGYKGPESHPDNPWFPAASGGYAGEAARGWAPAQLSDSARPQGNAGSVFVAGRAPAVPIASTGGSAKRAVRFCRATGSKLVMHAHKKAASSTRNQGHKNNPHYWGVAKKGLQGNAVKVGQLLVKQRGYNWYPGANVEKCDDFSLRAMKDGIVQWRGTYKNREVSVVPWEYVRTKCQWINPNTLGPKEYEPWMGTHGWGKRHHILKLRQEWLQTEEGKAWLSKKEEKAAKQKEIQMKVRAMLKKKKAGVRESSPQPVDAGSDSEAEA